jgi:hypothetical protein
LGLGNEAFRFNERHALETGPPALVDQAFSSNIDRPTATRLHPPVPCVHVGVARPEAEV